MRHTIGIRTPKVALRKNIFGRFRLYNMFKRKHLQTLIFI